MGVFPPAGALSTADDYARSDADRCCETFDVFVCVQVCECGLVPSGDQYLLGVGVGFFLCASGMVLTAATPSCASCCAVL
ncbi:MAG: hypothetical protein OXB90_03415 [Acidimicrobiaceae bacterium]|nr:hypothetical protein [Acidimicrobiaceae bacterium]